MSVFDLDRYLTMIEYITVAYRGVNYYVRRTSGEALEVSATGAIFLQGVWGASRVQGRALVGGSGVAKPPDRKRF